MQLCIVMEKNWALSVDRCWLQALQFSVRLIDLLSILLRYKDFAGIQKAVMDQTHQIVTSLASRGMGTGGALSLSPATWSP